MDTNLHEIIFCIEVFFYSLFAFFLITYKKGNRLANRLFAAFLLSKTIISIPAGEGVPHLRLMFKSPALEKG